MTKIRAPGGRGGVIVWIKDLGECQEFIAGDGSYLKEILNPRKQRLALRYSLAWVRVPAGHSTRPHRLVSSEVYYILDGGGEIHIDLETRPLGPGQTVYIPPGARQWVENPGPEELRFLCIVDPAWRPEDEDVSP